MADLPDGSPTIAVKSPMISTATWPRSWNRRSRRSTTAKPEVDVGGGRVDAELDAQRRAAFELGAQLGRRDDVDRARGQQLELAVDVHGRRR